MLKKLIDELAQELSMQELIQSSQQDRRFLLPFDDDIQVNALQQDKSFLLKGIICPCPENNAEAFLTKTMSANLFGAGTRNGSIGMDELGKLLTLSMELHYNCSYKDFKEKLEDFVSVISYWREEALRHR